VEDTDLKLYKDTDTSKVHSFYGLGCPQGESPKTCNIRIVETYDNEYQEIGTYYTHPAATSGASSTISTDNTNTPDTFCPLGWQLPYSGTGGDYYDKSRSWKYLFRQYGYDFGNNQQTWRDFTMKYPMSYIDSGRFNFRTAMIGSASDSGFYWSETVNHNALAYNMILRTSNISQATYGKNDSLALRCTSSSTARWKEHWLFQIITVAMTIHIMEMDVVKLTEKVDQTNPVLLELHLHIIAKTKKTELIIISKPQHQV